MPVRICMYAWKREKEKLYTQESYAEKCVCMECACMLEYLREAKATVCILNKCVQKKEKVS